MEFCNSNLYGCGELNTGVKPAATIDWNFVTATFMVAGGIAIKTNSSKMIIFEKKHRLPYDYYKGENVVSFVLCVANRKIIFDNVEIFLKFEKILNQELQRFECESIIHLFMPDHVHLILQGKNENSNVIGLINMFKQKTGYWFYKNTNQVRWQKDYYDHIIRNDKDITNQVYYVLYNPVRKGISENWKEYKLKGSSIYNFDEWEL